MSKKNSQLIRLIAFALGGMALLFIAIVIYDNRWVFDSRIREHDRYTASEKERTKNLRALLSDIQLADRIPDDMERCSKYPALPGIHWDARLVSQLCRINTAPIVTLKEINSLLVEGRASEIDRVFDGYASANFSDPAQHGILIAAFNRLFEVNTPEVEHVVQAWVDARPVSAYALTARGAFYTHAAYEARGSASSRNTPEASFAQMRSLIGKAQTDLHNALKINPRLTVATMYLIYAGKSRANDDEEIEQLAANAIAVDPSDALFYITWLGAVDPRWGGSIEQVDRILKTARTYSDRDPLMAMVEARGEWIKLRDGKRPLRKQDYDRVLAMAPDRFALLASAQGLYGTEASMYSSQLIRFWPTVRNYMTRYHKLQWSRTWSSQPDLDRALALSKGVPTEAADVAEVARALGKPEEAAVIYRKELERNPRDLNVLANLISLDMNDLDNEREAEAMADRYAELVPGDPSSWEQVARVTAKTNAKKFCDAVARARSADSGANNINDMGKCSQLTIEKPN